MTQKQNKPIIQKVRPVWTEYVENPYLQPFEFQCPKCKGHIYGEAVKVTLVCPGCGACLIRKDYLNVDITIHENPE